MRDEQIREKTAQLEEGITRIREMTTDMENINEELQDKAASLSEMEELRRSDTEELETVRKRCSVQQCKLDETEAIRDDALQKLEEKSKQYEEKCVEVQTYIELQEDIFKDNQKTMEELIGCRDRYSESSEKLQNRTNELEEVRMELKATKQALQVGKIITALIVFQTPTKNIFLSKI